MPQSSSSGISIPEPMRPPQNAESIHVPHKTIKKITCLGSGFVGGPMSAVTAFKSDVLVTVVDIDSGRIGAWQSGSLPIYEPGLYDIVSVARDGIRLNDDNASSVSIHWRNGRIDDIKNHGEYTRHPNLFFSTDIDKAIEEADLIFLCVNTPTKKNGVGKGAAADLEFVEAATRTIARVAREGKIVVEKSTVPCETAQHIRGILLANSRPGVHFDVLSNPEFLAEGTAINDLLYPDRIIIGSMPTPAGRRAAASLAEVYAKWVPQERIITMNLWSSELSKLAANAMLAQRISSVNALSAICEATGADVDEVSHACGLDSRIGPGMLKAGPGFGGSCFQKDIFNIVYLSESLHLSEVADYWRAIINVNEYQKQRFTNRIISSFSNDLTDKKIAVLGFAFKKDTSDTRESPAISMVRNFVAKRAQVAIYDPQVKEQQIWKELVDDGGDLESLKDSVSIWDSAYDACAGTDAVVIVTEWDEFSNKTSVSGTVATASPTALRETSTNHAEFESKFPMGSDKPTKFSARRSSHSTILPRSRIGNREYESIEKSFDGRIRATESARPRRRLDWARIAKNMRKSMFVFDGRGILDVTKLEALGFQVETIGRASAVLQN